MSVCWTIFKHADCSLTLLHKPYYARGLSCKIMWKVSNLSEKHPKSYLCCVLGNIKCFRVQIKVIGFPIVSFSLWHAKTIIRSGLRKYNNIFIVSTIDLRLLEPILSIIDFLINLLPPSTVDKFPFQSVFTD